MIDLRTLDAYRRPDMELRMNPTGNHWPRDCGYFVIPSPVDGAELRCIVSKTCNTCWFAGMDLKNEDGDPSGPLKNTCMVHGRRIRAGSVAWEEDRPDSGCPGGRDISTARAVFAARRLETRP
jgi:hypothetical protein